MSDAPAPPPLPGLPEQFGPTAGHVTALMAVRDAAARHRRRLAAARRAAAYVAVSPAPLRPPFG